jgi:hypothetical protein
MMATPRTPDVLAGLGQGGDDGLAAAMGPQARLMDGAALRMDGGTQPREEISDELVLEYKEAMQAGAQFPSVVAYFDGSAYWLADGYHRVHAADAAGLQVLVDVRQGTRRDAVLYSVGANAAHGMRRTNADKRRSVLALLHDDEWRQWSDREIARRCAVSDRFVNGVRAELSANGSQIEKRRVQRNGTEYTMTPPQRSAASAVAAQGGKYAAPVELVPAVRSWLVAYDTAEEREAALAEVCELGEGSVTFDDLAEWIDVKPRQAEDLIQAAKLVLNEVRWEMAGEAEPETVNWRRTRGTITEDGRVLVQMSDGTKSPPWLELDDAGQHWMMDMIQRAQGNDKTLLSQGGGS